MADKSLLDNKAGMKKMLAVISRIYLQQYSIFLKVGRLQCYMSRYNIADESLLENKAGMKKKC